MTWVTLKVATEFTTTPGARLRSSGPYSGEAFREDVLIPRLEALQAGDQLEIDMDGAAGYAGSWLEEVFGGVVRRLGPGVVNRFQVICGDDPSVMEQAVADMLLECIDWSKDIDWE